MQWWVGRGPRKGIPRDKVRSPKEYQFQCDVPRVEITVYDYLLTIIETVWAKKEGYKINSKKNTYLYPGDRFFLGGVLLEEHFLH